MGTKNYTHIKSYGPFKGLNRGVSDFNLPDGFFSKALNATVLPGSTALSVRPGWQVGATTVNSTDKKVFAGLYVDVDTETGVQTEKELLLNITAGNAELIEPFTITITNATAFDFEVAATVNIDPSNTRHRFQLINTGNNAVLYTTYLVDGSGIPDLTINALVSAIDALSDFSATLSSGSNGLIQAATALPISYNIIPADSSREIKGYTTKTIVNSSGLISAIDYNTLKPVSYTNLQNALYFAIPGVGLCKFDGQVVTRAGVPRAIEVKYSAQGAPDSGGLVVGRYVYAYAYEVRDINGNILEGLGECSRPDPALTFSGSVDGGPGYVNLILAETGTLGCWVDLQFKNLPPTTYKHDVRYARINGAQSFSVSDPTLTVFSGHTMQPGDRFCIRAVIGATSGYGAANYLISGLIASVTATSITFASTGFEVTLLDRNESRPDIKTKTYLIPAFTEQTDITLAELDAYITTPNTNTVANNANMSNNVRLNLYRNKGEGVTAAELASDYPDMYLLDIVVPFSSDTYTNYRDTARDLAITIRWEQKIEIGPVPFELDAGLSKQVTIAHSHQGRMYLAGNPKAVNTLYRSDLLYGPEFYNPFGFADLNLETKVASKITAIGSTSDNLIVGKNKGIQLISGDLSTDSNIRVDDISFDLGLVNQASTISAIGKCIGLTQLGPIEIDTSGNFQFIGSQELGTKSRLEAIFKQEKLDLNFASTAVNMEKGYYMFYVPTKQTAGVTQALNDSFNQFEQQSANLTNIPEPWGKVYTYIVTQDAWFEWDRIEATGGMYIKDGRFHAVAMGDTGLLIQSESDSDTLSDYADYREGIQMDVATNWIDLGEPYMYKQFIKALIQNAENDPLANNAYNVTLSAEKDWVEDTAQTEQELSNVVSVAYKQVKIKGNKSRSMRIRLSANNILERPAITGVTVEISAPFRPKIKQE